MIWKGNFQWYILVFFKASIVESVAPKGQKNTHNTKLLPLTLFRIKMQMGYALSNNFWLYQSHP